jgi:serine/threonine protein kinase
LGYLHANKIVHRDLKPENVLMDESGYIKLADFGLAKFLQPNQDTKSFCGTAEYLAPEILDMKGHSFGVDWWTLGILIYEMVTGRPPFMHSNHHRLGVLIRQGVIIFPNAERHGIPMTDDLKDLITKLLDKNQSTRLGAKEDADEIVNHPWFADVDWDALMAKTIESPFKPDMNHIRNKQSDSLVHKDKKSKDMEASESAANDNN